MEEKIQYFLSAIGRVKGAEYNVDIPGMLASGVNGDGEREGSCGKKRTALITCIVLCTSFRGPQGWGWGSKDNVVGNK